MFFCIKYYLLYLTGPRVLRIETKQVPRPSQAEVVLSDGEFSSHCLVKISFFESVLLVFIITLIFSTVILKMASFNTINNFCLVK